MTTNDRIAEMSRAVYAWCAARTATPADAEDLSQEVLLEMLRAAPDLRDERAFYGFMWAVAGHVYRSWLRKKRAPSAELTEAVADPADPFAAVEVADDLRLLRRELSLLGRQCRQAAVGYYVRGMKVAQVAAEMGVSVSMVKYLLFKARNIIREGMEMERNYGEQSYQPRRLDLRYWGHGPNHYYGMAGTLLRQNILYACYNDVLTAEQIALAVGVGLPYMEEDLDKLHEMNLLTRDNAGRYRTNIVIFTEEYNRAAAARIAPEVRAIADEVKACITQTEAAVRSIGFTGSDMNAAAFAWQMAALLLHRAVIGVAGEKAAPELPRDKWGVPCLCWGVEQPVHAAEDLFAFGTSHMDNSRGDWVQCMDFPVNGDMVHHKLYNASWANVFLAVARGDAADLSENDQTIAAELVRLGYVRRTEEGLRVRCPVFTNAQYTALTTLVDPAVQRIAELALAIREKEAAMLREHVPEHLRNLAKGMVYFRLFESGVSQPAAMLHGEGCLKDARTCDWLPTTYAVIRN